MFARERGVLVAVVDIQSGTWKMAREIFEVLQKEITTKRKTVNEINTRIVQEVATDIGLVVKYTSDIWGKTAKKGMPLDPKAVMQFYGRSSTGKTQICHTLCVTVQELHADYKSIYIDTFRGTFRGKELCRAACTYAVY